VLAYLCRRCRIRTPGWWWRLIRRHMAGSERAAAIVQEATICAALHTFCNPRTLSVHRLRQWTS
jgi:hypothetical protein